MTSQQRSEPSRAGPEARRRGVDPDRLSEALLRGDRRALARAITLAELTRTEHRRAAEAILRQVLPRTGAAIRLGITGTPGVGKSTFIEAFGRSLTAAGHKVAVLAVDPSSARSGGSILGDKTRMEELARDPNAFIRPSPAGRTLGGVARRTREAMLLAEAAGFDAILVETVGVGQSETAVAEMVDMFLLLLAPAGGDDLQGIKRGIMELADLVVVNKADGAFLEAARRAAADYRSALSLIRPRTPHWRPRVQLASAQEGSGIAEVWQTVTAFRAATGAAGAFEARRAQQARAWMWREVEEGLLQALRTDARVASALPAIEAEVAAGRLTPSGGAQAILARYHASGD